MPLEKQVELLLRSSLRLKSALATPPDNVFWIFMRKELWLHMKRTMSAWWLVFRKKM